MQQSLKHLTLAVSLLAANTAHLGAQTFFPPVAVEYTFGDPQVKPAQNTSCYSLGAGYCYFPAMAPVIGTAAPDLYVAGWNSENISGLQEVTVLLTAAGDPLTVLWKASIPYDNVQDLEVGSMRNTTTNNTNILVAYYKPGIGHLLDIYALNPFMTNPQFVSQQVLSHSPTYGRIRMDFHATYEVAIAWVNTEPGANKGIQTKVYTNNTWSGIATLAGTANKTGVDIGLTRVIEPVNNSTSAYLLHFAYSGGGFVTESSVNMTALATAVPGTVTPAAIDNLYVGAGLNSRLVLDCADFSTTTNPGPAPSSSWAYTYSDGMNVIVRHKNPFLASAGKTKVITSGMLGNNPLGPAYKVFSPALNYGGGYPNSMPQQIMVAWYTTDGAGFNGYTALQMDVNGTTVTSTPDYLLLPNAQTPTLPSPFTSGIALSKVGPEGVGNFLYATYFDVNPTTGEYQLHHAFHKWGDTEFKGENTTGIPTEPMTGVTKINVYPNPFVDRLHASISLEEDGVLQLELHDLAGRLVWQYKAALTKGSHQLKTENIKGVTAGAYVLTASLDHKKIDTKMIVKQ